MRNLKKMLAGLMALVMCLMLTVVMSSAAAPTLTGVEYVSSGATAPNVNNTANFMFDGPITNVDWTKVKLYYSDARTTDINVGSITGSEDILPGGEYNAISPEGDVLRVRYLDGSNGSSSNQITGLVTTANVSTYLVLLENAIDGDSPAMYLMMRGNSWSPVVASGTGLPSMIQDYITANTPDPELEAIITKTLTVDDPAILAPDATFTFGFEAVKFNDTLGTGGALPSGTPTIAPIDIEFTEGGALTEDSANIITGLDPSDFPQAGWYEYKVTEDVTGLDTNIFPDNSEAEYVLKIGVANKPDGTLYFKEIVLAKITDDDGDEIDPPVKDGDFEFINKYTPQSKLTVTKTIAGDYANMNEKFTYTVTFPDYVTGDTQISGKVIYGDGSTADLPVTTVAGVATVLLGHGDKVEFDVIAATEYSIVETAVAGYTQSANITDGEEEPVAASNVSTGVDGDVVEGGTIVDWTNTFVITSPTGILIDNLPFIMLGLITLLAIGGYLVIRRRRLA